MEWKKLLMNNKKNQRNNLQARINTGHFAMIEIGKSKFDLQFNELTIILGKAKLLFQLIAY